MAGALERIWARLFAPVDVASLVAFRIAFGALMAWESYQYLVRGRVAAKYVEPTTLLPWAAFEWLPRYPGDGLYYHFYGLIVLGACIAAGVAYRLACVLFCAAFTYLLLLSPVHFQNHFYLICLLSGMLAFIPAHRSASFDARLRPSLRSETAAAWGVWVLRLQLGILYFYGGVAKLNADWLQGYPMRLWLPEKAGMPLLGFLFEQPWVAIAMSWSGLLIDLLAFPALLWRRSRPFAIAILVSFHLWNSQIFVIGIFPWFAIATLTIFLEPDWPRRVFDWRRRGPDPAPREFRWTAVRRAGAALAVAYFALQVALPLRHHLYPGNPGWTQEGHAFAWRMKLIDLHGRIRFDLRDPATGQEWSVDPGRELTPDQASRLAVHPELIHLYARRLARLAAPEGGGTVEVRAHTLCSFNGRRPQPIVDPQIDLASEPVRTFGHQPWILPIEHPLDTGWLEELDPR